jgi:hypothetical protein
MYGPSKVSSNEPLLCTCAINTWQRVSIADVLDLFLGSLGPRGCFRNAWAWAWHALRFPAEGGSAAGAHKVIARPGGCRYRHHYADIVVLDFENDIKRRQLNAAVSLIRCYFPEQIGKSQVQGHSR